jgi:hypothetical protein
VQIYSDSLTSSGALIQPQEVLTAAHCVEQMQDLPLTIRFQGSTDSEVIERKVLSVKTFMKEGSAYFPNYDLARLELDFLAPTPYRPIEIYPV